MGGDKMLDFELSFAPDAAESMRVPFSGSLAIALFEGQALPERDAFEAVEGFNLSHTGISFATPTWPTSDRLMVALGDERAPVLVSARVITCHKCVDRTDENDSMSYEVECEFEQWHT